jgi:ABC-type multidrug transport system ATPase subunit
LEDREAVRTYVGYCPQVDPLLDLMTAYETLWFFGRIRGVDEEVLKKRVDQLVQQVGLAKHAHRPCGTYSGGNKRKLSLAIALISDPRLLLLDEPSTGMDPAARRNMWSVIEQVSQDRSIVLVSHSMEECEALCTRMCVLVSGRLKCLGSAQHIKGKFGASYQLEVRCAKAEEEGGGDESVDRIIRLCQEGLAHCGGATVDERHSGFLRMSLDGAVDLAAAFALLEASKDTHGVLDYSIAQATLEQVFISFAKEQEEETGPVRGMVSAVAEAEVQAQAEGNKGLVADSKEALDGGVI